MNRSVQFGSPLSGPSGGPDRNVHVKPLVLGVLDHLRDVDRGQARTLADIDLPSLDREAPPLPDDLETQQGRTNVERFRPMDGSPAPTHLRHAAPTALRRRVAPAARNLGAVHRLGTDPATRG